MKTQIQASLERIIELLKTPAAPVNSNFLNADEAARYLAMSKSLLYKLSHQGEIPKYKPSGGLLYFKISELDEWIESAKEGFTKNEMDAKVDAALDQIANRKRF